ncbi:hypothetical protein Hanom_Chr09g00830501 [Helianthus anomalus]
MFGVFLAKTTQNIMLKFKTSCLHVNFYTSHTSHKKGLFYRNLTLLTHRSNIITHN